MIDKEIEKLVAQKKQLTAMLSDEGLPASTSGKTHWQMAEIVLEREKRPLHTRDVQRRIEEEFKTKVDFKSLSQVLHAKSSVKKYFFKDKKAPNTYGLLKWNSD
jgi:hypothetical protein